MVHDDVLLPDRREAVAPALSDPLREPRIVGLELEVRPVQRDQLAQFTEGKQAINMFDTKDNAERLAQATKA